VVATSAIDPTGATVNQSFRLAKADRAVIKLVTVGNPGNHADAATGFGKVDYVYQIGQYMVKNSEYAAFLNAVATATNNPHTLWNPGMQIEQNGTDTYSYAVVAGAENRPINFVSTLAAMRFCNWLNNGAAAGSDTETGAYAFTGETNFSARAGTAKFFLPTENEYYKAAYYDPTKGGSDYWLYAVRTDDPDPTHAGGLISELPPGGAHSANFDNVAGSPDNSIGTTDVGAYTAASSYYGTFDQSGNQWEWIEPAVAATTTRRMGGSQGNNAARLAATVIATSAIDPTGATVNQSFRVAAPAIGAVTLPPPVVQTVLSIKKTGPEIQITWTGAGILQSAVALNNSWTAVPGTPSSPYVISNPKGTSFYRILQQ
jgi:formylglycine-generating enzyme required for sulfatase activity